MHYLELGYLVRFISRAHWYKGEKQDFSGWRTRQDAMPAMGTSLFALLLICWERTNHMFVRSYLKCVLLLFGLLVLSGQFASAQTFTWTGGGSNSSWANSTSIFGVKLYNNWNGGQTTFLPNSASTVVFGSAFTSGNPVLAGNRTVAQVNISTAASFSLENPGDTLGISTGGIGRADVAGVEPNHFINCRVQLNNNSTVAVSGSNRLIINGVVMAGRINKTGTSPLVLTAANLYAGPTTVDAGFLYANNSTGSATGTGPVTVKNNGTLAGNGFISGSVTVESGGTVSPGDGGKGILTFNSGGVLHSGSILDLELGGGTSDKLVVNAGAISTNPGVVVRLTQSGALNIGDSVVIATFQPGVDVSGMNPDHFELDTALQGVFTFDGINLWFNYTGPVTFVRASATGANDGTSWTNAYTSLLTALTNAQPNDVIWVSEGTYRPSTNDRTVSFQMKNGIRLYGGFPSTGSPTFVMRNWQNFPTILSGGNYSYQVVKGDGVSVAAGLDGFIIENGRAYGSPATLTNRGGGVAVHNGNLNISNTVFRNNVGLVAAGLYLDGGTVRLFNTIFHNNVADVGGAAGGAIYKSQGTLVVMNSVFVNNSAVSGGAIYSSFSGTTVRNSIFWDNTASSSGNNFAGFGPVISHSCIQGGFTGTGNINVDPQFVNPAANDYRLAPTSPCVDVGSAQFVPLDYTDMDGDEDTQETAPRDFDGNPRVLSLDVDMGAFEVTNPQASIDPPTGLTAATLSSFSIQLDWDEHPNVDVNSYSVYRSLDAGFSAGPATLLTENVATSSYTDTGLKDGFIYHYQVTANTAGGGRSGPSNTATATTTPIAEILYVKADAAPGGDGSSWSGAYNSLHTALEEAGIDDQIWVAEGTYPVAQAAQYNPFLQTTSFMMKSGVALLGGFPGLPGQEGQLSHRNPDEHPSILDGQYSPTNKVYSVVRAVGVDDFGILDGFVIRNGSARGSPATGTNVGGGLRITGGSPIIRNSIFENNEALFGAGISIGSNSTATIDSCLFRNNATIGGGDAGGGIGISGGAPLVVNSIFHNNSAAQGSGVFGEAVSGARIVNSTFSKNTRANGTVTFAYESQASVTNTIIWGNNTGFSKSAFSVVDVTYTLDQGGYAGEGNLNTDPLFVDSAANNFRLQATSPAINAGLNSAVPAGIIRDFAGSSRIVGSAVDMGAFELLQVSSIVESKQAADGASASLNGVVVSRVFGNTFYVQNPDRSSGIRVVASQPFAYGRGAVVGVNGIVKTTAAGERYIELVSSSLLDDGSAEPLKMVGRNLGGADFFYNAISGTGQRGVPGGSGLNNIGLLVGAWGRVTHAGSGFFYLDDGSGLADGSGHAGVRVILHSGSIPLAGDYVSLSGASILDASSTGPVIWVEHDGDIQQEEILMAF